MSKITFVNKVDLYEDTSIADINKVKASDMNEIKTVVNNNDDNTTTNTNAIGTLADLNTTNKDNLVNAINELSVDYIVEEVTSGIWTYRKWNSGIVECWTTTTIEFTFTSTKVWGSVYESPLTYYNYPTNLFINDPNVIIQKSGGSGGWLEIGTGSSTARTPGIYIVYPVEKTSSTTAYISIYASDKWK